MRGMAGEYRLSRRESDTHSGRQAPLALTPSCGCISDFTLSTAITSYHACEQVIVVSLSTTKILASYWTDPSHVKCIVVINNVTQHL